MVVAEVHAGAPRVSAELPPRLGALRRPAAARGDGVNLRDPQAWGSPSSASTIMSPPAFMTASQADLLRLAKAGVSGVSSEQRDGRADRCIAIIVANDRSTLARYGGHARMRRATALH